MSDRPYRIAFIAKPIVVRACDEKQAIEVAIKYLLQPDSDRIRVEPLSDVSHD
jgi:hypothetical protein